MARLHIDCTATYFSGLNTGIQRTTKKIIENSKYLEGAEFDNVYPVIQFNKKYYYFSQGGAASLTSLLHKIGAFLRNFVDFKLGTADKKNIEEHESNKESITHSIVIKISRYFLDILFYISRNIDSVFMKSRKVEFYEGDILFIPDSFWDPLFSFKVLENIRKHKCKIILFIHDLFPITHPNLVSKSSSDLFKTSIEMMIPLIDGYICNSNFTLSEVAVYLNIYRQGKYSSLPASYVHLGADIFDYGLDSQSSFPAPTQDRFYLIVGTIEPKKNHDFVLNSFERLWHEGYQFPLVIVGRVGWKCDKIIEKVKSSKYLDRYLFMYNDVLDEQLISFYQKSSAVIMASLIEGYGLPLVEAMQFEKPVFASDIPIFREIGGDYPFYFDLSEEISLSNLVKEFENSEYMQRKRELPHISTWKECVTQLRDELSGMAR